VRHLWVSETELDGKVTNTKIGVMQVLQKEGGGWKLLARSSFRSRRRVAPSWVRERRCGTKPMADRAATPLATRVGYWGAAMSLRAELVRLGLRCFLKRSNRPDVTIATRRRHTARFERCVPPPPAGTETLSAELGGVAVRRIATPASLTDRHILFLHGGGYVTGSPELLPPHHLAARRGGPGAGCGDRLPAGAGAPVPGGAR